MGLKRSSMPTNGGYSTRASFLRGNLAGSAALCALNKKRRTRSSPLTLTVTINSREDNFVPEYLLVTRNDE